ncbi:MAG: response regulator transcription factor [Bacteroidota bacterium]
MKIRCIAVDDEPLALEKMSVFIDKVNYLELLGTFDNGFEAMNFMKSNPVDLVFLDIQMDELTGIQMLEVMTQRPKIIFITAYDQYAIKSYELEVVDYLLKPISFKRFLMAVEKVYKLFETPTEKGTNASALNKEDFILVRSEYRLQKVNLNKILFIEGMKDYSRIYTDEVKIMTLQNLKKIEEVLPNPPFFRVHKSYIISADKVDSIGKNDLTIGEQQIPIGGLYKKTFLDFVNQQRLIG